MNKYRKSPILLVQDTVMPKIVGGFTNSATDRSEKGANMIHIEDDITAGLPDLNYN